MRSTSFGEVGVIGNYRVPELGATRFSGQVEFIYGECECPILEDPDHDSVRNDRQKLIENDRTNALLEWVRERVESLAERMETKNRQQRKAQDLKNTSALNEILNRWKDRFMNQVWTEMFAGQGPAGVSGGFLVSWIDNLRERLGATIMISLGAFRRPRHMNEISSPLRPS
jgi:hypothetical protein